MSDPLEPNHYPDDAAQHTCALAIAVMFDILAEKGVPPEKLRQAVDEVYPDYYEAGGAPIRKEKKHG
jgi:hypothetical protein